MTASAAAPRLRFETVARDTTDPLPRMDVAAFVGFAASGPVHVPVVIEDVKQYTQVFGVDPLLAWDAEAGEPVRARLGAAVRTFFANGGRRCWVVRVAGAGAVHNYVPLPGIVRCVFGRDGRPVVQQPGFARARSPGSWSDGLRVRAAARALAAPFLHYDPVQAQLTLASGSGLRSRLQAGDLVRLRFGVPGAARSWLYARVRSLLAPATPGSTRYQLSAASWFADEPQTVSSPGDAHVVIRGYTAADGTPEPPGSDAYAESALAVTAVSSPGHLSLRGDGEAELTLSVGQPWAVLVQPGAVLHLDMAGQRAWFVVRRSQSRRDTGIASPPVDIDSTLVIEGSAYWLRDPPGAGFDPGPCQAAEAVTLDLRVRDEQDREYVLQDIGLANGHARGWSSLNGDQHRYRLPPRTTASLLDGEARAVSYPLASATHLIESTPADSPPVSGDNALEELFIPLGLGTGFSEPIAVVTQPGEPLQRDGLASYDASLFLDPGLAAIGTLNLMAEADYLRYFADRPRPLRGVHAVLGIDDSRIGEEATLIAVPDAMHRGWAPKDLKPRPATEASGTTVPESPATPAETFADCAPTVLSPPAFLSPGSGDITSSSFRVTWSGLSGASYTLEESETPDFTDTTVLSDGPARSLDIYRPQGGGYYYRVRATVGGQASAWSAPLWVAVRPVPAYVATPLRDYDTTLLQTVHSALLRLCAAHGELFAVLGLPRHFREPETRAYLGLLVADLASEHTPSPRSYGAVYHPWLLCRTDTTAIETIPPDGAAAGVVAARTATRGAWVAPANQSLKTVVALTHTVTLEDEVPVNLIRNEPHGFLALRADTLDPDLRLINVRRLLILLRRLALRHGASYAFEPNSEPLRRLVQSRFEGLLRGLYDRGAFSGLAPTQAYRVDTDASVNTRVSVEQGRFIVELRVRPSLPMEFITVRLMQHGDQLSISEAR